MSKALLVIVLYLAFGGYIVGGALSDMRKECGQMLSLTEVSLASIAWPAMFAVAVTMKLNGQLENTQCTNKPYKDSKR